MLIKLLTDTNLVSNVYGLSTEEWSVIGIVSTFLGAIITASTLIYTMAYNRKLSFENNKMIEEANRPNLGIYSETLIANKRHFYLVIRNYGKSQAVITSFEVDDISKRGLLIEGKDFTKYLINSTLAPNQSLTFLAFSDSFPIDHVSKISLVYKSTTHTYSLAFEANFNAKSRLPSVGISSGEPQMIFLELYQDYLRRNL